MKHKLLAEFLGTMGLLIVVVGSGIMGEALAKGNAAIALLANSLATGAGLYALIQTFGPISGAHFNPAVSLSEYSWQRLSAEECASYVLAQIVGGWVGVVTTHLMFGQAIFQLSTKSRDEPKLWLSEFIATAGLILVIALSGRKNVHATPAAVALFITSAYWCTSSTSFANPAVTIARSFTDTFSGVLWTGMPAFIIAQLAGTFLAIRVVSHLDE